MEDDWKEILKTDNGKEKKVEEPNKVDENEKYMLASGLYKCCRIGDAENALKFAEVLRRKTNDFYVMRILTQLCGEDLSPNEYNRIVPTIRTIFNAAKYNDLRGHDIWQCVYLVATAKKWYQTDEGRELEKVRHMVNKENLTEDIKLNIQPWIYDYHTREGREGIKNGKADLRLDGRWQGRFSILKRWEECLKECNGNFNEAKKRWIDSHY